MSFGDGKGSGAGAETARSYARGLRESDAAHDRVHAEFTTLSRPLEAAEIGIKQMGEREDRIDIDASSVLRRRTEAAASALRLLRDELENYREPLSSE